MESFLERRTAYRYRGQGGKAGTAERGDATMVQTRGNIRAFPFSGDKNRLDSAKGYAVKRLE